MTRWHADPPVRKTASAAEPTALSADALAINWAGAPLRSTLMFLAWPAAFMVVMLLAGGLPKFMLYIFGAVYCLALFVRTLKDPEWLLALVVLYMPFSLTYKVAILPGINATNLLILLMIFAWVRVAAQEQRPFFRPMPMTAAVWWWFGLSVISVFNGAATFGMTHITDLGASAKAWFDHIVVFFCVVNLIRNGAVARRVGVYTMISLVVVVVVGFDEWVEKRDVGNLDKARLGGPQGQPNDFGAYLVYGVGPFLALFINHYTRLRTWALVPFLLVYARVLIGSFSRGAYLGFALAAAAAAYVRGKIFISVIAAVLVGVAVGAPELIPESVAARMGLGQKDEGTDAPKIDKSSETRLIMWKAAMEMSFERPFIGYGYGAFPVLKAAYTEVEVHESDNHNMYLYLTSQFGIPMLLVLAFIFAQAFWYGRRVAHQGRDPMARALGMGMCATVAGALVINMFGSRMVDLCVMSNIWFGIAVLSHLVVETQTGANPAPLPQPASSQQKVMR